MNRSLKFIFNNNYTIFFLAIASIILVLLPYWIFNDYSALGWYDERDAVIPWYFSKSLFNNLNTFLHGYVGGTNTKLGFLWAGEELSFYRWLLQTFDLWIANLLMRGLGFFVTFSGSYVFLHKVLNCRKSFAFIGAFFALLVNYIPYGWTLGGFGWDFGIISWLLVAFFAEFNKKYQQIIFAIAISSIAAVTSAPLFLVPLLGYTFLFVLFIAKEKINFNKNNIIIWTIIWLIFTGLMVFNWFDVFFTITSKAKLFSSRVLGTLTAKDAANSFIVSGFIKQKLYIIYIYYKRSPHSLLFITNIFAAWLSIKLRCWNKLIIFLLFSFFIPIIIEVFFTITNISYFSQYRWENLYLLQPLMIPVFIGILINKVKSKHIIKASYYILAITTALASFSLVKATLKEIPEFSLGNTSHYKQWHGFTSLDNNYRVATGGNVGPLPLFYNIDTFNGMLHNSPFRKNYFIAYGLYDPAVNTLHTHRHFFYNFPKDLDLKMLELANVRYVITDKKFDSENAVLLNQHPPVYARDINYLTKKIFGTFFNNFKLLNPLYVYQLKNPWPRVFTAKDIHLSNHSYKDKEFYQELKRAPTQSITIASEDIPKELFVLNTPTLKYAELKINNYYFTKNSTVINVNNTGGVIVLNQVVTPLSKASCDKNPITLFPVNGIMTAVIVPAGCSKVEIEP